MSVDLTKIELGEGTLALTHGVGYDGSGGTAIADVGATNGAEFSYKKIHKDIEIGQALAAVKSPIIGEEGTFKVTLMETDIDLIAIGMGGDPANVTTDASSETFQFGGDKTTIMHKLVYTVPQLDDAALDDVLTLHRCRIDDLSPIPFSKGEERKYELTFKIFPITPNWVLGDFVHQLL